MNPVTLEVRDRVAYLTLNRPEAGNALDPSLIHSFRDAAESLDERDDVGAVVLTGAGKNFCVGGDLRFMYDAGDDVADAVYGLAQHDARRDRWRWRRSTRRSSARSAAPPRAAG